MSKLPDNSQSFTDGHESYYERNSEERRAYQKDYYRRNKKRIHSKRANAEKADPTKKKARLEYNRAYYLKNRTRILQERARRYKEHKQPSGQTCEAIRPEDPRINSGPLIHNDDSSELPSEQAVRMALDSLAKALPFLREEIAKVRDSLTLLERTEDLIKHLLNRIKPTSAARSKLLQQDEPRNQVA